MSFYQNLSTKISLLERRIKEKESLEKSTPWYLNAPQKEKHAIPWYLHLTESREHMELGFYKFLLVLTRILMIVKGTPSSNFHVFTQAGKDGVYICNYSYCHYKSFHNNTKYKSLATIVAATVILSLIVALVFPGKPISRAATVSWIQGSWADGVSASNANDTNNRTNWTYYSGADANITAGATVVLAPISDSEAETSNTEWTPSAKSVTDTTDTNFNAASPYPTHSSTVVSGSDTSADVKLIVTSVRPTEPANSGTDNGGADLIPANGSTISGSYYNVGTFRITSGYTVYIPTGSVLQIKANTVDIAGILDGNEKGYAGGSGGGANGGVGTKGVGPSGVTNGSSYGTTGGAGGAGGAGSDSGGCGVGVGGAGGGSGSAYGNLSDASIDMGGGAAGGGGGGSVTDDGYTCFGGASGQAGAPGNRGGGAVYLFSSGAATVSGTIRVNGGAGGAGGAGGSNVSTGGTGGGGTGGAGGGILINGSTVTVGGTLTANGGAGGSGGGTAAGSGGAGRIKLFASSTPSITGSVSATGQGVSYTSCNSGTVYCQATTYASSGTFTSRVIDVSYATSFGKLAWTTSLPTNTSITVKARSCDDSACVGETAFGSISESVTLTDGAGSSTQSLASLFPTSIGTTPKQYIQYQATLSTTDASVTPTLSDVTSYYESTWSNAVVSATDVKLSETCGSSTVQDANSNTYDTVSIGTQCWLKQNLKTGTRIGGSSSQTNNGIIEKHCYSDSDASCTTDGGLYVWNEAMGYVTTAGTQGICPSGWHIPQDSEWYTLENYLKDGANSCVSTRSGTWDCDAAGTKLKTGGSSDFEGVLAGVYFMGFLWQGTDARLWSSTENGTSGWVRGLSSSNATVLRSSVTKETSSSVRCVRDSSGATYYSSGTFTSQIIDTGQPNAFWDKVAWSADTDVPVGASMSVKVRTCDDSACSGESAFTSITETTSLADGAGDSSASGLLTAIFPNSVYVGHQYVQYQVTLNASSDGTQTPTFADLTIHHRAYSNSQTLTSSAYDTNDDGVLISAISWSETLPGSGSPNIKLQVRTAPNSGSAPDWTSGSKWCGPATCAATTADDSFASDWYETTPAGETVNSTQRDSSSDRWIQYKVWLTGDKSQTPTLSSVNIQYVSNSSPKFCKADLTGTPAVCPDGQTATLTATYNDTGSNIGKITLTSDYPTAGASSYPITDNEEGTGSGKDLDGKVSTQYFYDAGITLTNGPLGTDATSLTASDPNIALPATGTIMIDNDLASSTEKVEVIAYTSKTGTTSATLSGLTRSYWPAELGDAGYTTQKTTHTNSSKIWVWASSATAKGEVSGVSLSPKTISTATFTLTPSTDLGSQVYLDNTAKIRIAVNDGNAANQIGTMDSATFTLDTKSPVYTSYAVKIDGNATPTLTNNISAAAGSTATYMRFSNSDITALTCADSSTAWEAYAATKAWTLVPDSNGVSTVYWQFKDNYCNMTSGSSATPQVPGRPSGTSINLTDISYVPTTKWRQLIWWNAQGGSTTYKLYRTDATTTLNQTLDSSATTPITLSSISLLPSSGTVKIDNEEISYTSKTGSTLAGTITRGDNSTTAASHASGAAVMLLMAPPGIADPGNYCFDEGDGDCTDNGNGALGNTTTYTYKVLAQDTDGISVYSSTVSGVPNGSTIGEVDATDPVISSGPTSTVGDTTAAITFTATDASSMFYSVIYEPTSANGVDPGTYTKQAANPSMKSTGESGTVNLAGLASGTWHAYKILARDIYGNPQSTPQAGPYYFQTSIDSSAPSAIADLAAGAANITATTATLTWTAPGDNENIGTASSYDIRYSTVSSSDISTNWATASQVSNEPLPLANGNSQSMTITNLTPSTTYYFAMKTSDEIPNTSALSNVVTIATPSQTDTTIPIVDALSVSVGTPTSTTVAISWTTTNKASSSLVDFGPTTSYGTTQGNSSESTTSHSVTLVGLTPGTSYKFRVKSVSSAGNTGTDDNGGAGYSFTTDSAVVGTLPTITSVSSSSVTATTAVITWTTTGVSSDSIVGYSVSPAKTYDFESGSTAGVTSHSVTLTGLSPLTQYYYRVKSRNGDQMATASSDAGGDFNFTTLAGADVVPPIISNLQVATVTANSATITWDTLTENSNSYVDFGTASGVYTSTQGKANDSVTSHSVQLTSLTPETAYYFRVRSVDGAGNEANQVGDSFSTTSGNAVDCPPCRSGASCTPAEPCPSTDITSPQIESIKVTKISFSTATVTWKTDEESDSIVEYDTTSFGIKQSYGYSSGNRDFITSHSITLTNLDSASTYYFRVSSADAKGNVATSEAQSFKTIAIMDAKDQSSETVAADLKKEFEDIAKTLVKDNLATEENIKEIIARISNPPVIGAEGPMVKDIKSYGATVFWKTDRKSNATVKFKPVLAQNETLGVGENWQEVSRIDNFDTAHEVGLLGLAPSTTYSFYVQSQDILGSIAKSEAQTFTTQAASSIFSVAITDLNLNQATINWETSNLSTSSLEWGLSSNYGNYQSKGEEKVNNHSITLLNLSSGTTYHYRVRSVEASGTILSSDDYTFTTFELPQITKYALGEVKDTSVSLTWTSNIPIDTNIRYTDKDTGEVKIQGKEERILDHSFTLTDLEAGKSYKVEIQGRDEKGNLAEIPSFDVQTGMDKVAPELTQVRSQSAILGGAEDKVQAIISWRTNELSDTKVLWDLGSSKGDNFNNETKLDPNLTTNHISVITSFKPGTVYRFRVVSTDKFGNISTSPDYTILTPVRRQSIIQMIVNQFEGIFGWMKKVGR